MSQLTETTIQPDKTKSILIVLPTYNEIENLPSLVKAIRLHLPVADILVVDDNSPDGTGTWCDKKRKDEPKLACLHRAKKNGLGEATLAGLAYALEREYTVVITMDADFSHNPALLPAIVKPVLQGAADVVIGSRYCEGGGIEGWPWYRKFTSILVNKAARGLLKLPTTDCSGAFRAYSVPLLRRMKLQTIQAVGYSYLQEILFQLKKSGASFYEVPIVFQDRFAGKSKLGLREAFRTLRTLTRLKYS